MPPNYQVERINKFSFMPLEGDICMKNPEQTFVVVEDHKGCEEDYTRELLKVYFCRLIGYGQRNAIDKFNLKKREYIGTTSMDAELSLIMANMGLVENGSIAYDPFVGTGSFLLTCAFFGTYTFGSDIDGRQIRGKQGKSISSNIAQYGLGDRVLDCFVCDFCHPPWRNDFYVDAIVTDPPYAIRAGAKRIGAKEGDPKRSLEPEKRGILYPSTVPYQMEDIIKDLVKYAAKRLTVGGRLVYWLPIIEFEESDERTLTQPPLHPALKLIANSEQNFGKWRRCLITMEKITNDEEIVSEDVILQNELEIVESFRTRYFKTKENLSH
jgi:tRNA (guanine10-N2)-methyltransferase